jgi:hypothetical protein
MQEKISFAAGSNSGPSFPKCLEATGSGGTSGGDSLREHLYRQAYEQRPFAYQQGPIQTLRSPPCQFFLGLFATSKYAKPSLTFYMQKTWSIDDAEEDAFANPLRDRYGTLSSSTSS